MLLKFRLSILSSVKVHHILLSSLKVRLAILTSVKVHNILLSFLNVHLAILSSVKVLLAIITSANTLTAGNRILSRCHDTARDFRKSVNNLVRINCCILYPYYLHVTSKLHSKLVNKHLKLQVNSPILCVRTHISVSRFAIYSPIRP